MAASTVISFAISEAEAALLEKVRAWHGMDRTSYLRFILLRRQQQEPDRPLLPTVRGGVRSWPISFRWHGGSISHLMSWPDGSPSSLMRALIHDDARRLGIMFDPDWSLT
jgi:hypothetical protein